MITIEPKMVNIIWARSPFSIKHVILNTYLFLDLHLTTHHSNISVQVIVMLD